MDSDTKSAWIYPIEEELHRRQLLGMAEARARCAEIARSFPQLLPLSPKHVRQVTGEDIAKAIEADQLYTPKA